MREKLIELLKLSPNCICDLCGEKGRLDEVAEIIADNLIANGVTFDRDINVLTKKIAKLEKSNRNWRRKYQRLKATRKADGERRADDERTG